MARTSARTARTDAHRPSAIVPADYDYVLSFSLATTDDGWPVPAININCETRISAIAHNADGSVTVTQRQHRADGRCCVIGIKQHGGVFATDAGPGRCSVCGTHYVYGDVWFHRPTQEYICLGHDCADKYSLLADRSEWEMENLRTRDGLAKELARKQNDEERAAFLAKHPGLSEALECQHNIVRDIAQKFITYRALSEKQIALVFKLANEAATPKPAEQHVAAPTGKTTFRGTVVSAKSQESQYGTSIKITVKVSTPEGTWLAWGTAPSAILNSFEGYDYAAVLRGCEVEITATLEAGKEPHFVFMKRPRGKVTKKVEAVQSAANEVHG